MGCGSEEKGQPVKAYRVTLLRLDRFTGNPSRFKIPWSFPSKRKAVKAAKYALDGDRYVSAVVKQGRKVCARFNRTIKRAQK